MQMTSTRPYLIRGFYDWIVDNDCTPHIVVNAEILGTDVPREYIEGGQIVLNISMSAVHNLNLNNDFISFHARFNGIARHVHIPVHAVLAIYARENGRGMVFTEEDHEPPPDEEMEAPVALHKKPSKSKRKGSGNKPPHLTVVK